MFGDLALVYMIIEKISFLFPVPMIFSMIKKPVNVEKEATIYKHICDNPGIIASDIVHKFNICKGTVRYYTRKLEYKGKIVMVRFGKVTRMFSRRTTFTDMEKTLISCIWNNTNKMLLTLIIDNPGITNRELSEKLDMNKSIVHRHLKKLVIITCISSKKEGRNIHYYINEKLKEDIIKRL